MSVSTQDRLNRLKELERIRLEKQERLLLESQFEPTILPKFESRITLSRTTVADSIEQKSDTKNEEKSKTSKSEVKNATKSFEDKNDSENEEVISEVYEVDISDYSLISRAKQNETSKEEEVSTVSNQTVKQDKQESQSNTERKDATDNSSKVSNIVLQTPERQKHEATSSKTERSEVQASNIDESSDKINVSNVDSFKITKEDNSSSKTEISNVDSEPKKAIEKDISNIKISNSNSEPHMSPIKNDSNSNTELSTVVSDPPRTLSTSYVGPLSPTSTEKTRISVVRKMTLDSLPTVTTTTTTESSLQSSMYTDSHTREPEKDKDSDKTKQTQATTSYLKLKDFRLTTRSQRSSSSVEHGDDLAKKEETGSNLFDRSSENTEEKTMSLANVEVGPTIQSPLTDEKVVKETDIESNVVTSLSTKTGDLTDNSEKTTSEISTEQELTMMSDTNTESSTSVISRPASDTKCITSASNMSEPASNTKTTSSVLSISHPVSDSKIGSNTSDTSHPEERSAEQWESACKELSADTGSDTASKPETVIQKVQEELYANFDARYASIKEEEELQRERINELEKKRKDIKASKEPEKEDLSQLSARERFLRNQAASRIKRPVKKQSVSEQIRASRLSRRNSDYSEGPRSESPGKAAEAESPPIARRNRMQARSIDRLRRRTIDSVPILPANSSINPIEEKPKLKTVIDTDAVAEAFDKHNRERLSRLERLRTQNQELSRRRDSDPSVNIGISGTRPEYQSSLIVNRGSSENIAQFPIHEHLESSFPSSRFSYSSSNEREFTNRHSELLRSVSIDRPSVTSLNRPSILRPSYSESRLFPLDGGRLSNTSILSMSTESDLSRTNQEQSVLDSDPNMTPILVENAPLNALLIDNELRTNFDSASASGSTWDTYSNVLDFLDNASSSSFESMYLPAHRRRAMNRTNNLLDPINYDHFLADCFLKKYTLKERCALIRDKIYGTDSNERGKPDGASHDSGKNKGDESETDT